MSDECDAADAHIEARIQEALSKISAPPTLPDIGACHNCGAELYDGARYCNSECAEEHEWFLSRKKVNSNRNTNV